eukprot:10650319-Ditylum_brightwellii.AAC.1
MSKVNKEVISRDFVSGLCKYPNWMKTNGECQFKGKCRTTCLQAYKKQVCGHCTYIKKFIQTGEESSTMVRHFVQASNWYNPPQGTTPTPHQIMQKVDFDIIYQGNL